MKLVIFGLTVSSSCGNGHTTLWRALLRALAGRAYVDVGTLDGYREAMQLLNDPPSASRAVVDRPWPWSTSNLSTLSRSGER